MEKENSQSVRFNPKIWTLSLELGAIYLQSGVNEFSEWQQKMIEAAGDKGDKIKVWLPAIWEMLKIMPKISKFNDKQIAATVNLVDSIYENGTTNFDDIYQELIKFIGAENAVESYLLIKSAYVGVCKFFDNLKGGSSVSNTTKKSSGKKTVKKKTSKEDESVKKSAPSPLEIQDYIDMGRVELSETQAISVALVRNVLKQEYLAIQRTTKTKDGEWKVKGGIWLPFSEMQKIGDIIYNAYNEGLKMGGWGNTYQPTPKIYEFEKIGDKGTPENVKQMILPFAKEE